VAKEGGILMLPEPYFMTNEEWYYFDEESFMYKLTDKAPQRAQESYTEFYSELDAMRD
jgi:hypothetical protein